MKAGFTYYAFISYSQRDEGFARKVQHYLEHYKLPSVLCREFPRTPRNFHPVFRDKTDLPLDNLSNALRDALAASEHLIVICSPHSANPNAEGQNWVNWEVDTFLSLRSENAERVIPLILRKKQEAASLPSGISERPFAPLDTAALGNEQAFIEAIARMTGLSPATLWEHQRRRQKRRRLLRRLCGAAATLAAVAGGWWYWDYYCPHYSYYVDYVERDNIPHGLFPLKEKELAQHAAHYRFTNRLHVLEAVEYRDMGGKPLDHTAPWHHDRPARMDIRYTREAGVNTAHHRRHLNAAGKAYETLAFSPGAIDMEADAGRKCRFAVTRNAQGVITRVLFNTYGSQAATTNAEGMHGLTYELDDMGRTKTVRYLSARISPEGKATDITPGESAGGIAGYHLHYDSAGHTTGMSYINKDGAPAESPSNNTP